MARTPARTLTLRPADPFDLIRWLARSQSDPRKAVAEFVQNSIDAQARHVAIEGAGFSIRGEGARPAVAAEAAARPGATGRLRLEAEEEGRRAAAEAVVEAVESKVDETGSASRSRTWSTRRARPGAAGSTAVAGT